MTNEWIELPNGDALHKTTVDYRMDQLGWSIVPASRKPVQRHRGKLGNPNIAARARADRIAPSKIHVLMRQYGASYEEARDYIWQQAA